MWKSIYFPLLSPNTPVSSTSLYWSAYGSEVDRIGYGEESGTGYLIWVIFRAAWAQQILFSPGRIPDFVSFMLAGIDKYTSLSDLTDWLFRVVAFLCGRTHADSLVAESVKKSATGSDQELAWQALWLMQLCPLGMM